MIELYGIRASELPALYRAKTLSRFALPWSKQHPTAGENTEAQKSLGGLLLLEAAGVAGELCYTGQGRPYLAGQALDFSISHTREHVFCAIGFPDAGAAVPRIGLDAEELARAGALDTSRMAERWFSDHEKALLQANPTKEAFLRIWTRKEALVKYMGVGLAGMRAADTACSRQRLAFFEYTAHGVLISLCADVGTSAPENVTLLDGEMLLCRLAAQNRAWKE